MHGYDVELRKTALAEATRVRPRCPDEVAHLAEEFYRFLRGDEGLSNLRLNADEARALRVVCARIAGNPERTARGEMDSIREKLERAGVKDPRREGSFSYEILEGEIRFHRKV